MMETKIKLTLSQEDAKYAHLGLPFIVHGFASKSIVEDLIDQAVKVPTTVDSVELLVTIALSITCAKEAIAQKSIDASFEIA